MAFLKGRVIKITHHIQIKKESEKKKKFFREVSHLGDDEVILRRSLSMTYTGVLQYFVQKSI